MFRRLPFGVSLAAVLAPAVAEPLAIDLTAKVPAPAPTPIGQGTTGNPDGVEITADSRSLFLGGRPWMPVCGEFHYSRYPASEWRDELLKMRAGGIGVVSTYVFWIHHEEERGKLDWSGDRSLRDFLKLCQECGLKAIVRMGPWCHGEVRNGGFPDWVQNSGTKLRTTDPEFLALVKLFYQETAAQMNGLLWKEGGPVIAVQMDNECHGVDYLLALKKMARDLGVDVPLYTMTGWNRVPIPKEGLLPLFGAYADGFWGGTPESYRKSFLFSNIRDDGDLGARMQNVRPGRNESMEAFPFACCEIGPGMMSSYRKRVKIDPADAVAMALVKLGCGNNMPGYYMVHGGINPEGKLSTLQEEKPNFMPIKDYDFQTALGAAGEVRPQYHLLRQQHLLLEDAQETLARMPVYFPEKTPADLMDTETFRWSMRADDEGHGFVFFSNRQPVLPLPVKSGVQLELRTRSGIVRVPRTPIDIPEGAFGIWPVGMDCSGVTLDYATAQPLCHVAEAGGAVTWFFTAIEGVRPELALAAREPVKVTPGTGAAVTVKNAKGSDVSFVVLTPEQGRGFSRQTFAGRERAMLSNVPVFEDGSKLRFQIANAQQVSLAVYPPGPSVGVAAARVAGSKDGVFARYDLPLAKLDAPEATATLEKPAGPKATTMTGDKEATWQDAAVYQLNMPANVGRRPLLQVRYFGDAARLYVGDRLVLDNFFNGDAMAIPLWRISRGDFPKLRLKVLPWSDALARRLPESAKQAADEASRSGKLNEVRLTIEELREIVVKP